MPSSIVQGVVEGVLEVFLEVACYYIGRMVVPAISLGRWKCDRMTANVPRRKLRAAGFYHVRGGQVYLTTEATMSVGLVTVVLLIGGGVLVWYLRRG